MVKERKKTIPIYEPSLGKEELANVVEVVKSGWISSQGKFVSEFEKKFAEYCGAKYGVATSSGTTALHLALVALGIKEGDEVIVPTLTFIATANAVRYTGARPVFVDSCREYWCIDPDRIEEAITPRTKAIIPVHLYGHPADMEPIMRIAERHNLYVIADECEAHGAEYKGRKVGSFGHINCFSYFINKIITSGGEGGMCLTNSGALADKMRILRSHGMNPDKKYWHDVVGFNYRLTALQASVGVAQLGKIDAIIAKKRQIAEWYKEGLEGLDVELPPEMPWAKNIYWLYTVLLGDKFGISRDELIERLKGEGIETRPLFYPIHTMPPYKGNGDFPVAEELSRRGISLPSGATLTRGDAGRVVGAIRRCVK